MRLRNSLFTWRLQRRGFWTSQTRAREAVGGRFSFDCCQASGYHQACYTLCKQGGHWTHRFEPFLPNTTPSHCAPLLNSGANLPLSFSYFWLAVNHRCYLSSLSIWRWCWGANCLTTVYYMKSTKASDDVIEGGTFSASPTVFALWMQNSWSPPGGWL